MHGSESMEAPPQPLEEVRRRIAGRLTRALEGNADIARRLEISVFNAAVESCKRDSIPLYWENPKFRYRLTTRALSMEQNLKNSKNQALKLKILSGELAPRTVARMTPQQLFPELYEEVYQRLAIKQLRRMAPTIDPLKAPDGAFTCRCGSRKTMFYEMQTRSADEPMTLFITCRFPLLSYSKNLLNFLISFAFNTPHLLCRSVMP